MVRLTAAEIAELLGRALSTVTAILRRLGLGVGRLRRLALERPTRYERSRPGELVHLDVKRLGRIEGGAGKRVGLGAARRRLPSAPDPPPAHPPYRPQTNCKAERFIGTNALRVGLRRGLRLERRANAGT